MEHVASPTVGALIQRIDLKLRPVVSIADQLGHAVRWVHSSDLADPTPFLSDAVILLTTGRQFEEPDAEPTEAGSAAERRGEGVDAYVRRLVARGVLALGFGTEVLRDGVPPELADACSRHGLTLFEVPYDTPFIAIARAIAEAVTAQAYERRSWALAAQRAISLAALRPDGLARTLVELGQQLGTWVGLYDATGVLIREHPAQALSPSAARGVAAEADAVLRRGARAASTIDVDGAPFTLQTLGRGGRLRGVLAIGSASLDQEGRGVVTSVVAMAGLALEQQEGLQRARARMRSGVVELLVGGQIALARAVAREIPMPLPQGPVVVAIVENAGRSIPISDWLELTAADQDGEVFGGRNGADLLVILPEGSALTDAIADRFAARIGVSEAVSYADLGIGIAQARTALRSPGTGVVAFADRGARGVLDTLPPDAQVIAAALLRPLHEHDTASGSDLTGLLRTYLENDGSHEVTGRVLALHRHTVRSRVQQAERILGLDLGSFPVRAELWAAFRALSTPEATDRSGHTPGLPPSA